MQVLRDPKVYINSSVFKQGNEHQQKSSTTKSSPSALSHPHIPSFHPSKARVQPLNGDEGDTTMNLTSSMRKHKKFHESDRVKYGQGSSQYYTPS